MTSRRSTFADVLHRLRYAWPAGHVRNIGMAAANDFGDAFIALAAILHASDLVTGTAIDELETRFADVHGESLHAATFSAGRVALAAILHGLAIGKGDEVIVPGYTCVAVPNPVIFSGARPIYADIDAATLNLSWETIEPVLSGRTRAVLVQHTFGIPVDVIPIIEGCRARGIAVIEDCTHALGAIYNGRMVGNWSDAAFFSAEQTKVISTGSGGFTLTRNRELAIRIREFQESCAWPTPTEVRKNLAYIARLGLLEHPWLQSLHLAFHYYFDRTGWFGPPVTTDEEFRSVKPRVFERRMSNGVAKIGLRQLENLPANLAHRRSIAALYDRRLPEIGLQPAVFPEDTLPAYVRYPVRVPDRSGLLAYARAHNIHLGEWFSACVHPAEVDQQAAGYDAGNCPVAEKALVEIINLPTHPRISAGDAHQVIEVMSAYLGQNNHVLTPAN